MKAFSRALSALLSILILVSIVSVKTSSLADNDNPFDQAVPFGFAHNEGKSSIEIYSKPGTDKASGYVADSTLCSILSIQRLNNTNWYYISFFSSQGIESHGYIPESDFIQLTVAGLIATASDNQGLSLLQSFSDMRNAANFLPTVSTEVRSAVTPTSTPTKKVSAEKKTYILNTNTKKFHRPSCHSVNSIKNKNKRTFTGTRREVINMGYTPCKNCNP